MATTAKRKTTASKAKASAAKPAKLSPTKPTSRVIRSIPIPHSELATGAVNKQLSGFIEFLREQSVVGLAIGLVMGTQVKQLVDSLIQSFINPLVGILLPGKGALDQKTFTFFVHGKVAVFAWGSFATTFISFTIVAAVIYFTFKLLKLDKLTKKKADK